MQPYTNKIEADNATNRQRSREGRDIAEGYPPAGDLTRRGACGASFRRFCEDYFPAAFNLPWSDDHLRAIDRIEDCVLRAGFVTYIRCK